MVPGGGSARATGRRSIRGGWTEPLGAACPSRSKSP